MNAPAPRPVWIGLPWTDLLIGCGGWPLPLLAPLLRARGATRDALTPYRRYPELAARAGADDRPGCRGIHPRYIGPAMSR